MPPPRRKTAGFLLLLLAALFLSVSCETRRPLKVGFIGQISGPKASPSAVVRNGVVLAVEEANEHEGAGGRRIELIIRDDGGKPEEAVAAVKELVDIGVDAIVGPTLSSTSAAALEVINEREIVSLSPTATADSLKGGDDYFYTFLSGNREMASAMVDFARSELSLETVSAILDYSNKSYTADYFETFRLRFEELGGKVRSLQTYRSDTFEQFGPLVDRALEQKPQGLVMIGSSLDTAMVVQQLYKRESSIPVISCDWASYEELIRQGGPYVDHVYLANVLKSSSSSEAYHEFESAYRGRYAEDPTIGGALGYEAVSVLTEALRIREREGGTLRDILLQRSFSGLEEELSFDSFGDVDRTIYIKTVQNRRFVDIEKAEAEE